jgi:hypothetical protein
MLKLIGSGICILLLVISWILSLLPEKEQFAQKPLVTKSALAEKCDEAREKRPVAKSKQKEMLFLPKNIPSAREREWQIEERRFVLGPQASPVIDMNEPPLPLRGGLNVFAPREIERGGVTPIDVLAR